MEHNIIQLLTTLFLSKLRKKNNDQFGNLFDTAIGLRVLAIFGFLRFLAQMSLFAGWGGGGACPHTPLEARVLGARKSFLYH